jgi:hypothetical protein
MQETIAKERPRRRMAGRVAAAGMALAAAVTLAGCHEARGGGYIGQVVPQTNNPIFNARADFGFNFQCDDGVKGELTYHDASTSASLGGLVFPDLRIHGTVENILVDDDMDPDTKAVPADTCEDIVEARWAQFAGSYRSQDTTLRTKPAGEFVVVVFDQGEPGVGDPVITGDGFSIELSGLGAPYAGYTRAGYIEGGNIQVDKK